MHIPKFKVGDVVRCIPGLSASDCGIGYKENAVYTIKIVGKSHLMKNCIYFFEEVVNGVFETALVSIEEERENKLNKIGI
jgi:hypothetical protein